jgi:ketosteroid isomerase-like protein
MTDQLSATERIARQIRVALEAADLSAFSDLLDPRVRWGAPDDPSPSCQSRAQVLAWYQRGRDAGVRATVCETVAAGDRILVGLRVTGRQEVAEPASRQVAEPASRQVAEPASRQVAEPAGQANRWQVLTVRDGRIVDIVGFDGRGDAAARAGLTARA